MYGLSKNVFLPYSLIMSEVISSFRHLGAGSLLFALLMLFLCVILHTMWSPKYHAIAVHIALWYVVLVCHQCDVCKNYVDSLYVCWSE